MSNVYMQLHPIFKSGPKILKFEKYFQNQYPHLKIW
jgi:hypothetical protein